MISSQAIGKVEKKGSPSLVKNSPSRRLWVVFSRICTIFMPNIIISYLLMMKKDEYSMKSSSQRIQAWREKVALCIIILLLSLVLWFSLWFFGIFLCPNCKVMSFSEFQKLNVDTEPCVLIYGRIFDLKKLFSLSISKKGSNLLSFYVGKDASELFAPDVFNRAMSGIGSISIASDDTNVVENERKKPVEILSHASSTTFGINTITDLDLQLSSNILDSKSPETLTFLEALANCWIADLGWDAQDLFSKGSSKDSPIVAVEGVLFNVSSLLKIKSESISPLQLALTSLPWSGFDHTIQVRKALLGQGGETSINLLKIASDMAPIVGIIDPRSPFKCAMGRYVLIGSVALVLFITGVKFSRCLATWP